MSLSGQPQQETLWLSMECDSLVTAICRQGFAPRAEREKPRGTSDPARHHV